MRLVGDGRSTVIKVYANSTPALKWDVGYTPSGTTTGTLKFTRDSEVRNMLITQDSGVTGSDGMYLTAAWNLRMSNVWIEGMSGRGINVPFRSDIYAAVSDYWQSFAFDIQQCRISGCTGWGIYFGGGQSPGLWRMQYCTIAGNAGGGVLTSTGQFVFTDNLVVGNGTYGANGGMLVQDIEGPSFVAKVERNEFDTNFNYHLWLMWVRNHEYRQNRFLSQTFDSNTGSVFTSGSAFMRPVTQVKLVDGATDEVWNCLFERNYHRSVAGAGPTTAAVNAYIKTPSSTEVKKNRFVNNDIQFRDGVTQNSSGMVRYDGISVTALNVIEDDGPVTLIAEAAAATTVVGTNTTVTFGTEYIDSHSAFNGSTFTAPLPGVYSIKGMVTITGLADGNFVSVQIHKNGAAFSRYDYGATGETNHAFVFADEVVLGGTDQINIRAQQDSGSSKSTVAGAQTRLAITKIR